MSNILTLLVVVAVTTNIILVTSNTGTVVQAFTTTTTTTKNTANIAFNHHQKKWRSSTISTTLNFNNRQPQCNYYDLEGGVVLKSTAAAESSSSSSDSFSYQQTTVPSASSTKDEEDKIAFLERTSKLCQERNLKFDGIKNARDLASVKHSPIQPNRLLRMGKLSDCSSDDLTTVYDKLGLRTIIDLRSPTELKEDSNLHRNDVFGNFTTIEWIEGKRSKYLSSSGNSKHFHDHIEERGNNVPIKSIRRRLKKTRGGDLVEESCFPGRSCNDSPTRQERHFVSLMDEFKYVRGVVKKMRKRDLTKVLLKSPGALWSRRVRTACKDVFLNKINTGGLPLLNELMSRMGASGIRYTLEVCSDPQRYPIAFHCTAGKDRTGLIAAIILSLVGCHDEDIVEDYSLSANVYAQMNDHKAMVGALSQRNLNAETFLGAPPHVMRETLESLREVYGSVEGYCDWIGFSAKDREKLIQNLTSP